MHLYLGCIRIVYINTLQCQPQILTNCLCTYIDFCCVVRSCVEEESIFFSIEVQFVKIGVSLESFGRREGEECEMGGV